jgi:hypothetical protein
MPEKIRSTRENLNIRNLALFVNFRNSFGKEMYFSTNFSFEVTLAHNVGATES